MNFPLIISLVAIVLSVASPFLTASINNRHERKMYVLRFYTEHRAEVIEKYLSAVRGRLDTPHNRSFLSYDQHYGEVFLYLPKSMWQIVKDLDRALDTDNVSAKQALYEKLIDELCKHPPRSEK